MPSPAGSVPRTGRPVVEIPLTIIPHQLTLNETTERLIRERVAWLERFFSPIIHCQVFVEGPGQHHRTGGPYEVRLDVRTPAGEIAIERQAAADLATAIRDSFDAARRKLEDLARRSRIEVKKHEPQTTGRVSKLVAASDYGFLETTDGREIYFHRNSVLEPGFDRLRVGVEVRFVEEAGEKGPQASTVVPLEIGRASCRERV